MNTFFKHTIYQRITNSLYAKIAIVFIVIISLISVSSWLNIPLSPYLYDETTLDILANPSFIHPLGTDNLGRDLLARIIYGSRLSLLVGFFTAIVAGIIGSIYGAIAGFYEGYIDNILMAIIDVIYCLPDLLVMLLLGLVVGKGTIGILISLSLISWMGTARIVRSCFIQLKNEDFVNAAKVIGANDFYIMFKHILPNTLSSLLVSLFITIPQAILAESTLSFIGLGLEAPQCSWGTLASDGMSCLRNHPNLLFFPSFCIFVTVLSLNLFGDNLRDALDPKIRIQLKK